MQGVYKIIAAARRRSRALDVKEMYYWEKRDTGAELLFCSTHKTNCFFFLHCRCCRHCG